MRSVTAGAVVFAIGCGGTPFGQDSPAGDELAGAPSSAGSIGVGGSVMPSGGAAGSSSSGSSSTNEGGSGSDAGEGGAPPSMSAPCDVSTWSAKAFATSVYLGVEEVPAFMFDDDASTRWASGVAREPGQWLELALGGDVLEQLELRTPGNVADVPGELDLVLDGKRVDVVISKPSEGVLRLELEPTSANTARLELTSSAPAWWSVAELAAVCR